MAEYIEREAVLNSLPEYLNPIQVGREEYNKGWDNCRSVMSKYLKEIPVAENVTPVVRCKSCRHSVWSKKQESYCCKLHRWVMNKVRDRDFCSYGRPKKDGDTDG